MRIDHQAVSSAGFSGVALGRGRGGVSANAHSVRVLVVMACLPFSAGLHRERLQPWRLPRDEGHP
jgi:hypothetical protein